MLAPMQAPPQQPPLLPAPTDQPALPAPPPPKWHDVTVVTKKKTKRARVEGVPPEEFGISRHARSLRDCGYCYHETLRTESDLIDEGYDEKQIKGLPSHALNLTIESNTRDTVNEGSQGGGDEGMNDANRNIDITEHYIRCNWDGKGAKLWRVCTGGTPMEVLRKDGEDAIYEEEAPPFAAMTPVIMTHRFFGRSIADLILDIQRIKTALLRGLLDNQYLHNNPRCEVGEDGATENTLDDLLVSRPGGVVRTKRVGSIAWQEVPDITPSIYPALQYFDATREWRTGVSRQGQGVDPNALQNQVATIANQMFDAAQAKLRLIARIFAETGVRDLFQLLHGTIRRNGSVQETVRLRNTWVTVDPRDWKERNDTTINVGLGTGNKQEQLAQLQLIIGAQKEAVALGLVSKKNFWNSAKELCRLTGRKDPENYFVAPAPPQPQLPGPGQQPGQQSDNPDAPLPPPPNPDIQKAQMQQQAEMAKMQKQSEVEKIQAQADIAAENAKIQAQSALDQQKFKQDAAMQEREYQLKEKLALMDAELKREQAQQQMQIAAAEHAHKMQQMVTKSANDQQAHVQRMTEQQAQPTP